MKRITSVLAAGFAAICLTASVQAAPLSNYEAEAPIVEYIEENVSADLPVMVPSVKKAEKLYLSDNAEQFTYEAESETSADEAAATLTTQDVLKMILFSFIAGLIIALIVCLVMKSRMKTARNQLTANDYIRKNSFNITRSRDIFIYSEIAKKKRVKEENKK